MGLGDWLGWLGALVVSGAGAVWVRRMRAVRIPRDRRAFVAANALGAALGVAAFARGADLLGGLAAGFAVAAGGIFLLLRMLSAQQARVPAVGPGDQVPDVTAPDEDGRPFALSGLRGRPYLLKFFRGHW